MDRVRSLAAGGASAMAGVPACPPHAAPHSGREAKASGHDPTDYTLSPTARSFVPYYTQRLSATCVLNGARQIQKTLKRKVAARRCSAAAVA